MTADFHLIVAFLGQVEPLQQAQAKAPHIHLIVFRRLSVLPPKRHEQQHGQFRQLVPHMDQYEVMAP
jgi:hypothetical protein